MWSLCQYSMSLVTAMAILSSRWGESLCSLSRAKFCLNFTWTLCAYLSGHVWLVFVFNFCRQSNDDLKLNRYQYWIYVADWFQIDHKLGRPKQFNAISGFQLQRWRTKALGLGGLLGKCHHDAPSHRPLSIADDHRCQNCLKHCLLQQLSQFHSVLDSRKLHASQI